MRGRQLQDEQHHEGCVGIQSPASLFNVKETARRREGAPSGSPGVGTGFTPRSHRSHVAETFSASPPLICSCWIWEVSEQRPSGSDEEARTAVGPTVLLFITGNTFCSTSWEGEEGVFNLISLRPLLPPSSVCPTPPSLRMS